MSVRENTKTTEQQITLVTCLLGKQVYALPIEPVKQIIDMVSITKLPQVSQVIEGVINFHGTFVPVVNMGRLLGLKETIKLLHTPIILVNISGMLIGLMVDKVLDVITRNVDQVTDPNDVLLMDMGRIPILCGLIHGQDSSILVLNLDYLLKPARDLADKINTLVQNIETVKDHSLDMPQVVENTSTTPDEMPVPVTEPETKPKKQSRSGKSQRTKTKIKEQSEGGDRWQQSSK